MEDYDLRDYQIKLEEAIEALNLAKEAKDDAAKANGVVNTVLTSLKLYDDTLNNTEKKLKSLSNSIENFNDRIEQANNTILAEKKRFQDLYNIDAGNTKEVSDKLEEFRESLANAIKGLNGHGNDPVDASNAEDFYGTLSDRERKDISKYYNRIKKFKEDIGRVTNAEVRKLKEESEQVKAQKEMYEAKAAAIKSGYSAIKAGFGSIIKVGKDFLGIWGKIDQAASKFAKSVGTSARGMESIRKGSIEMVSRGHLAQLYGTTAEDLIKMQSQYTSQLGRNIQMSTRDITGMAQMSSVFGSQEQAVAFGANMQRFGVSMEESAKVAGKMFNEAGKYGINFEQYSKNFAENIKTAQSYTFKNGLQGLREMARKASEIRLDMSQIFNLSDKLSEGGIQGATEMGANLQVLGGAYAQNSDPLRLLYQGISDVEGLVDSFKDMVKSSGFYNRNTGEFEVSTFDKLRLRAASKAMGVNYNQTMESVNALAKSEFVKEALAKGSLTRFSEEDINLIANSASVKNGKPMLSWYDERGNRIEKSANDMTARDFAAYKLQNQSQTDDIKDIAIMLRGWDDVISGTKKQYENEKARAVEVTGIGQQVKNISDMIGRNTGYLNAILMAVLGLSVGQFATTLGSGFGQIGVGRTRVPKATSGRQTPTNIPPTITTNPTNTPPPAPNSPNSGPTRNTTTTNTTQVVGPPKPTVTQTVTGKNHGFIDENNYINKNGERWVREDNGRMWRNEVNGKRVPDKRVQQWRRGDVTIVQQNPSQTTTTVSTPTPAPASETVAKPSFGSRAKGFLGRNAGMIAMLSALIGSGIDAKTQQDLASGKIAKGSSKDYWRTSIGKALAYGGIGAQVGSMFGLPGMAIGAGVGVVAGIGKGIYDAGKRKKESEIDKIMGGPGLGVAHGRYSSGELSKIKRALEGGGIESLDDKLIDKIGEVGDHHILDKLQIRGRGSSANGNSEMVSRSANISPRTVDSRSVITPVRERAQLNNRVDIPPVDMTLHLDANSLEGREAGEMLVNSLKNNPIMLQNLSNMVAQSINISNNGANIVTRYGTSTWT